MDSQKEKHIRTASFFTVLFTAGLVLGIVYGNAVLKGLFSGNGSLAFMLFKPSQSSIAITRSLMATNEYDRTAAYYGLADSGRVDAQFLEERFAQEESLHIKRSIVYCMYKTGSARSFDSFCRTVYPSAPDEIKAEMRTFLKKKSVSYYKKFSEDFKIRPGKEKELRRSIDLAR